MYLNDSPMALAMMIDILIIKEKFIDWLWDKLYEIPKKTTT